MVFERDDLNGRVAHRGWEIGRSSSRASAAPIWIARSVRRSVGRRVCGSAQRSSGSPTDI